jgi:tyrosyl-tRNA synthetase
VLARGFLLPDGGITLRRAMPMHILDELKARGFVAQISDEAGLRERLDQGPITFYCGYDPTNTSLTAGNLVPVMLQAHLQRAGHRPIVVLGGGTALIGDPSGKTTVRAVLAEEEIRRNLESQRPQFGRFLALRDGDGLPAHGAILVDNADWLKSLNYIGFLRDVGRHFSVNEMIAAETYAARLQSQQHLSFVEFNYRLVQAYDFLHLFRDHHCELQLGGNDQWGNCVAGIDLIRKTTGGRAFVLTAPLLLTADGQKMGKTEKGAVWLDPARTSPFEYFQYWINVDDRDAGRFLRMFTFLPLDEIEPLAALRGENAVKAKARLAWEATSLAHGRVEADRALATSMLLFDLERHVRWDEVVTDGGAAPAPDVPRFELPRASLDAGLPAYKLFAEAGLAASGKDARRLVEQGGAQINGEALTDAFRGLGPADLRVDGTLLLRAGKKKYCLVVAR